MQALYKHTQTTAITSWCFVFGSYFLRHPAFLPIDKSRGFSRGFGEPQAVFDMLLETYGWLTGPLTGPHEQSTLAEIYGFNETYLVPLRKTLIYLADFKGVNRPDIIATLRGPVESPSGLSTQSMDMPLLAPKSSPDLLVEAAVVAQRFFIEQKSDDTPASTVDPLIFSLSTRAELAAYGFQDFGSLGADDGEQPPKRSNLLNS